MYRIVANERIELELATRVELIGNSNFLAILLPWLLTLSSFEEMISVDGGFIISVLIIAWVYHDFFPHIILLYNWH